MNLPKKHLYKFTLVLISLVAAISFGQMLNFDLWQDDNALIFKLQHHNEASGVFGAGILGLGA